MKESLEIKKGYCYECIRKFRYGKCMFFNGVKYFAHEDNILYDTLGNGLVFNQKFFDDGYKIEEHFKQLCSFYFKVGDFVYNCNDHTSPIYRINHIDFGNYYCKSIDGGAFACFDMNDPYIRQWTIDNAHDDDILALEKFGYKLDKKNKCLVELNKTEVWIPQEGDIIRKKGTEKPLFKLCGRDEQKPWVYTISQINEISLSDIVVTNVSDYRLMNDYEPVEKTCYNNFNWDNIQLSFKKEVEKLREEIDLRQLQTEFGKQFEAYMYHPETDERIMAACCRKLLELAKQEIVNDINQYTVDYLVHDFKNGYKGNFNDKRVSDIYRQGILDIIEKIKE